MGTNTVGCAFLGVGATQGVECSERLVGSKSRFGTALDMARVVENGLL